MGTPQQYVGTPQQYVGRFATKERGASPPGGVVSRPLFFTRTALKKGTTSLRSVVNKNCHRPLKCDDFQTLPLESGLTG